MLNSYEEIRTFYSDVFAQYGEQPEGAAWADRAEHFNRLKLATNAVKLMNNCNGLPVRILEVGCGWGILPIRWAYDNERVEEYTGIDVTDVYIGRAQFLFYKEPSHVFINTAIQDFPIVDPYGLTVAIGVIAWQPKLTATTILADMWHATAPGGLMLFTYLPGEPLAPPEINILRTQLGVKESCEFRGYAKSGEHMVIFKKSGLTDRDREMAEAIAKAEQEDEEDNESD